MSGIVVEREWSDMRPGDFVVDPAGKMWRFDARDTLGNVWLSDREDNRVNIGRPSGRTKWWDGSPEAETIEGFRQAMGATVLQDRH